MSTTPSPPTQFSHAHCLTERNNNGFRSGPQFPPEPPTTGRPEMMKSTQPFSNVQNPFHSSENPFRSVGNHSNGCCETTPAPRNSGFLPPEPEMPPAPNRSQMHNPFFGLSEKAACQQSFPIRSVPPENPFSDFAGTSMSQNPFADIEMKPSTPSNPFLNQSSGFSSGPLPDPCIHQPVNQFSQMQSQVGSDVIVRNPESIISRQYSYAIEPPHRNLEPVDCPTPQVQMFAGGSMPYVPPKNSSVPFNPTWKIRENSSLPQAKSLVPRRSAVNQPPKPASPGKPSNNLGNYYSDSRKNGRINAKQDEIEDLMDPAKMALVSIFTTEMKTAIGPEYLARIKPLFRIMIENGNISLTQVLMLFKENWGDVFDKIPSCSASTQKDLGTKKNKSSADI